MKTKFTGSKLNKPEKKIVLKLIKINHLSSKPNWIYSNNEISYPGLDSRELLNDGDEFSQIYWRGEFGKFALQLFFWPVSCKNRMVGFQLEFHILKWHDKNVYETEWLNKIVDKDLKYKGGGRPLMVDELDVNT